MIFELALILAHSTCIGWLVYQCMHLVGERDAARRELRIADATADALRGQRDAAYVLRDEAARKAANECALRHTAEQRLAQRDEAADDTQLSGLQRSRR